VTRRRRSLSSVLYRAARAEHTAEVLTSGDPARVARWGRNRLLSWVLGQLGVWRLWRRLWR
jgi:hypothetical protein